MNPPTRVFSGFKNNQTVWNASNIMNYPVTRFQQPQNNDVIMFDDFNKNWIYTPGLTGPVADDLISTRTVCIKIRE